MKKVNNKAIAEYLELKQKIKEIEARKKEIEQVLKNKGSFSNDNYSVTVTDVSMKTLSIKTIKESAPEVMKVIEKMNLINESTFKRVHIKELK